MWMYILIVVLLVLLYFKSVKNHTYWKKRGVPHLKPWPFVGNFGDGIFRRRNNADVFNDPYIAFPNSRYVGYYSTIVPGLLLRDPELIKQITIKEFDKFPQHRPFIREDVDPLWSKNLFAMSGGPKWQGMRATLSPSFTSSKMRLMFELMRTCAKQFSSHYLKQGGAVTLEMTDAFTRYTNDVIATTAFGVTCDSLENPNNDFYLMGKESTNFNGIIKGLGIVIQAFSPILAKILKIPLFSKKTKEFFQNIISETIRTREEHGIIRPDMIHLLMEARKGRLKHEDQSNAVVDTGFAVVEESEIGKSRKLQKFEITDEDILAQALVFFFAGFTTTATMMCHASYELAINPDIQDKLRKEVDEELEKSKGEITYEGLLGMKYLDMVISETLRKWPPNTTSDRESIAPYTIEPELPGEQPLLLEAGSFVIIPIYSIHRDPKNYPNPEKFDPERFSDENKHNIKPGSYLPFGLGPRNCIGSRFALLEAKLVIAEIISKFEITVVEKTSIPIVLSKSNFAPVPDEGFWLGLRPRRNNN